MKKFLQIASLLLLLTIGFSACTEKPDGGDESEESKNSSESLEESGENGDTMEKIVLFKDGKTDYVVIRPKTINTTTTTVIQDFFTDVEDKTRFDLRDVYYSETTKETAKEIIIGSVSNRQAAYDVEKHTSYSGCRVEVIGDKIVISGYSDNLLDKALSQLMASMKQDTDGSWYIPKNFNFEYDLSGVKLAPPKYETQNGTLEGIYACGEDNYEISVKETSELEYLNYINNMMDLGFTLYDSNKMGNNIFGTYTVKKDGVETVAYTMYYPESQRAKIVYGVRGYLPGNETIAYPSNPVCTPSITQLGRDMVFYGYNPVSNTIDGAPGMCYILQLADGRYIIFDGGPADQEITMLSKQNGTWKPSGTKQTEDAKKLYDFLVAKNPNSGKPVVAAWYFTHGHGDHTDLAVSFMQTYKNAVKIETVGYNIPDTTLAGVTDVGVTYSARAIRAAVQSFAAAERPKVLIFHSGQEIYFPGCEIEILYTHEDYYPQPFNNGNQTSTVFRVVMKAANGNETVFMVMGDAEKENCTELKNRYGTYLDCDIVQLTHHGFNGACDGLYNLMTPDICFWACDPFRYETDKRCLGTATGYAFNAWVRANVNTHYTSEYTTTLEIK